MTPLRFLCAQHRCPSRLICYHYVADAPGLPVNVQQLPEAAGLTRCRSFLAVPPGGKVKKVK